MLAESHSSTIRESLLPFIFVMENVVVVAIAQVSYFKFFVKSDSS